MDQGNNQPNHDDLMYIIKDMGSRVGKYAEVKWGPERKPVYIHDCVWKVNIYREPQIVFEICDKGNLDKDISALIWATTTWRDAKGFLIVFRNSQYKSALRKLHTPSNIYVSSVENILIMYNLLINNPPNFEAVKCIFSI